MILSFIVPTIVYLVVLAFANFTVFFFSAIIEVRLKNTYVNEIKFARTYNYLKIITIFFFIYINLFLVTKLTYYFYKLTEPHKVQLVCIIPILIGVSLLNEIRKFSKEQTAKEYLEGRFNSDINPLISYEMQKNRDQMTGFGSNFGILLFIIYYFFPNSFYFGLKLFFLS